MRTILFSLEDRRWVAENAVRELENSNNVKYRVVDLDKLIKKVRKSRFEKGLSPQISIMPIHEDALKERNYSFSMFYDREFGVYYGKFLGFSSNGEPKFKSFTMRNSIDLDITYDGDAELWCLIVFFRKLEGSVNQDDPYFKVYDESSESLKNTVKAQLFATAMGRIKSMSMKEKVYFIRYAYPAKNLSSNYTEDVLDGVLYEMAMNNPSEFNSKFASRSRSIGEVFQSGIQTGVIQNMQDGGYVFEGLNIGLTDMDVMNFLSKDNTVLSSVLDRIAKSDNILQGIVKNSNLVKNIKESEKLTIVESSDTSTGPKNDSEDGFL
jgi:hypothetical protein